MAVWAADAIAGSALAISRYAPSVTFLQILAKLLPYTRVSLGIFSREQLRSLLSSFVQSSRGHRGADALPPKRLSMVQLELCTAMAAA
jgi:hypothetical protein